MAFFPFMIQMQDKLCVIGGGGKVAYRKVSMMLSFGARVTVIAPKICDELQKIESKQDALLLVQRPFEDGDIEGADVVIMATNDSEVNSHIAAICKDKRILVNVVDVKKDCGFYFPAIINQDAVVASVSTGGSAPALASQIKKCGFENRAGGRKAERDYVRYGEKRVEKISHSDWYKKK